MLLLYSVIVNLTTPYPVRILEVQYFDYFTILYIRFYSFHGMYDQLGAKSL